MIGRLITPAEEWLDDLFPNGVPDDLKAQDIHEVMVEAAEQWLSDEGYDWDAFGAFLRPHISKEPT